MTSLAPSRSWTSAGCTSAPTSKPPVSVTMWRLRPLIFLAASYPRGPPLSVVLTDWVSMTPAHGAPLGARRFACLQQQLKIDLLEHAAVSPIVENNLARW